MLSLLLTRPVLASPARSGAAGLGSLRPDVSNDAGDNPGPAPGLRDASLPQGEAGLWEEGSDTFVFGSRELTSQSVADGGPAGLVDGRPDIQAVSGSPQGSAATLAATGSSTDAQPDRHGGPDSLARDPVDQGGAILQASALRDLVTPGPLAHVGAGEGRGRRFVGEASLSFVGYSVSDVGDANGDGIDDLIVGAPGDGEGGNNAGAAYLLYGQPNARGTLRLADLSPMDGFKIIGAEGDNAGFSVSGAGDVNGDGLADLLVGASGASAGGGFAGAAYVVYGQQGLRGDVDLDDLAAGPSTLGFKIVGETNDVAGSSVSGAGDVNGDGLDDVVVGAPSGDIPGSEVVGSAYVIFGQEGLRGEISLGDLDAGLSAEGFKIVGEARSDVAGDSVSGAGDVNGDGLADLIVGAPVNSAGGASAGAAYVIYGQAGPRGPVTLADLASEDGFKIVGEARNDFAGDSVSDAGDVNGDGLADIIVGASGNSAGGGSPGGAKAGAAYVVYGQEGLRGEVHLADLASEDGFKIVGQANRQTGDSAGISVSGAGDVNGDGLVDLLVGAPNSAAGDPGAGVAYVVFGQAEPRGTLDLAGLSTTPSADGFKIIGRTASAQAGVSVSAAGDVNDDGLDDLLVGAPGEGGARGAAYVLYGSEDWLA